MKKLLLLLFICVLIPLSALALMSPGFIGGDEGSGTCNVATDEAGSRTVGGTTIYVGENVFRCNLRTPECTGKLYTAYAYSVGDADHAKVCVYTDVNDDGLPDVGDTQLVCSGEITSSGTNAWFSDALGSNPNVSTGTNVFVCIVTDNTNWGTKYGAGAAMKYQTIAGGYATPPANLAGSWSNTAARDLSAYVTIGD